MKIDHIGIAVNSLAEGTKFYEALGIDVEGEEEVKSQGVRVAFLPVGETKLELLEPTGPDSPIARHIEKRGPGMHHLCIQVSDISAKMAELKGQGFRLLSDETQAGAHNCLVCFVHPKSTGGVLLELSQPGGASES